MKLPIALVVAALALAGASGFLASTAFSQQGEPTRTVTINVATGEQGPPGPKGDTGPKGDPGPPGPAGGTTCPTGFSAAEVVFIQKDKGPTTIFTCLKD